MTAEANPKGWQRVARGRSASGDPGQPSDDTPNSQDGEKFYEAHSSIAGASLKCVAPSRGGCRRLMRLAPGVSAALRPLATFYQPSGLHGGQPIARTNVQSPVA